MMTVFAGLGTAKSLSDTTIPSGFSTANGARNAQSLTGAMYFAIVVQMLLNYIPTILVFKSEEPVYLRERTSGLYQIWVYAMSKLLDELPIMLAFPMLMNLMLYFVVGYEISFLVFIQFYLILMMVVQAAMAMGYFTGSIFRAEAAAVAFAPIFNLPLTLLGGFMVSLKGIH